MNLIFYTRVLLQKIRQMVEDIDTPPKLQEEPKKKIPKIRKMRRVRLGKDDLIDFLILLKRGRFFFIRILMLTKNRVEKQRVAI